jgi:hypothetical protein
MTSTLFWEITQGIVVIVYQLFGTTYGSNFKVQESKKEKKTLKMGPIGCPETSVKKYHYTLRNLPEERRSQRRSSLLTNQIQ